MTKEIAVIGLGQFGGSVVKQLHKLRAHVTAIDISEAKVKEFEDYSVEGIVGSATDKNMLKSIAIEHYHDVIIAIGEDIPTSILSTLILQELGVENITAKAQSHYHAEMLKKVGATNILHPETEIGIRLANRLVNMSVVDYMEVSDDTAIVEYDANENLTDTVLKDIGFREKFGLNVIAIKRDKEVIVPPDPEMTIMNDDKLVMIGQINDLNDFEDEMMRE